MSQRALVWLVMAIAIVILLVAGAVGAKSSTRTAPCETVKYRRHVVGVLGTSEDLVGTSVAAWGELRQGHRLRGMSLLRAVVDYSPTFYDRERALVDRTVGCGV